jgi:uncharacterized membrane protein
MNEQTIKEGKTLALVSYIWLFGIIIAYFLNNDKRNPFVYFHVRQSLGIWLTMWAIGLIVTNFDNLMISIAFLIFFGVLFVYAFITCLGGKAYPIPLVGEFYQRIFSSLGK